MSGSGTRVKMLFARAIARFVNDLRRSPRFDRSFLRSDFNATTHLDRQSRRREALRSVADDYSEFIADDHATSAAAVSEGSKSTYGRVEALRTQTTA